MARILFEKKNSAIWLSHLDTMRLFQRAFRRANLELKHSQGFNPHAYVSVALPLSVGVESNCEILDYELDIAVSCDEVVRRLNDALPAGIRCLQGYENGKKIKYLTYLTAKIQLEYDKGCHSETVTALEGFMNRDTIQVEKRTKSKGMVMTDIKPMVVESAVTLADDNAVELTVTVCAQNPTLNPALLVTALETLRPDLAPDFSKITRLAVLDEAKAPFV
ncbi:MAG: TIGR03936 family radical SAM-associated protein [Eubacteriales bacterium]